MCISSKGERVEVQPLFVSADVGSVVVRYHSGVEARRACLGSSAVVRVVRLSDGSASDSSEDESLHPSLALQRCLSCTKLLRFTLTSKLEAAAQPLLC